MKRTVALVGIFVSATASAQKPYSGLGAESVSKEEVAKFAPPPLDARVSRRIQAMLDVRGAESGPVKYALQLTGGEDRTQVAGLANDDSFVVVSRDIGGEENPGLYVMKPDGGALETIQHTPKVQTFFEYVSDDSKSIYFRANDVD